MASTPCAAVVLLAFMSVEWVSFGYAKEPYEDAAIHLDNYPFPELNYDYDGLEPFVDERTMYVHHRGHHAAYTKKLNAVLQEWEANGEGSDLYSTSLVNIIQNVDKVPEKWRKAIRNNGGGYLNHAIFFGTISPNMEKTIRQPTGHIADLITNSFGNFTVMKEWFDREAALLFGSGYVWICYEKKHEYLTIFSTINQVSPISYSLYPIVVIDVWEHAYYLKHQNKRPEYVQAWWKVVNWKKAEKLLQWWIAIGGAPHGEL